MYYLHTYLAHRNSNNGQPPLCPQIMKHNFNLESFCTLRDPLAGSYFTILKPFLCSNLWTP